MDEPNEDAREDEQRVEQDPGAAMHVTSTDEEEILVKRRPQRFGSPKLAGGDLDAAWEEGDVGDEAPGGSVSTPDQDMVDEIGEAVGVTYQDTEPLHLGEKEEERDRHRWELDPASTGRDPRTLADEALEEE